MLRVSIKAERKSAAGLDYKNSTISGVRVHRQLGSLQLNALEQNNAGY